MRKPGCSAWYLLSTEGMSFLAWPAANSMPGTARIRVDALLAQRVQPVADDRPRELEEAVVGRDIPAGAGRCRRATASNSVIASSSRLPWPHTITPILLIAPSLSLFRPIDAQRANRPMDRRMFLFARPWIPAAARSPSTPCSAIRMALNRRQLHPVALIGRVIAWADAPLQSRKRHARSPAQFRRLVHDRRCWRGALHPGPAGPVAAARLAARLAVAGDRDVAP